MRVYQLLTDHKKVYNSTRREGLNNILTKFSTFMKPVMNLNETYSKSNIQKHLSDAFPIQNSLKLGDGLSVLLVNFRTSHYRGPIK